MYIKTECNIGDMIYIYDPEDGYEKEKIIDNVIITRNGDNPIGDKNILLRADAYDDVICTYYNLINVIPDEAGFYYFRNKKARNKFKELCKGEKN